MIGLFRQRAMQRNNIAFGKQRIKRDIFYAAIFGGKFIVCYNFHAEAFAYIDEYSAYLARSDNPNCLAVQVKTRQTVQAEIKFAGSVICFVNTAH